MYVIILAAGAGRRMGPLTNDKPRCLLEIGNETILYRQIRILKELGLDEKKIIVVSGYRAELLDNCGCNIVYNTSYDCTDNAYSLGLALEKLRGTDESVLILDGDLVFEENAIRTLLEHEEQNCVLVKAEHGPNGSTGVECDNDGYVSDIGKHINNSQLTYCSVMKLSADAAIRMQPSLVAESSKRYWYTVLVARELKWLHLKSVICTGKIVGVNTAYDYDIAKETFGIRYDKICVTGASGFLGKKICSILERDYTVLGVGRTKARNVSALDMSNLKMLEAFVELNRPNIIIHTVAVADPDTCDADRDTAYAVNVGMTKNLCEVCAKRDIKLILISTDYVFDGDSTEEYFADSERRPKNFYGQTKVKAEDLVKQINDSLIIRIPVLYGYNDTQDKQTFVTKMISELSQEHDMYLDDEQVRYPVLIDDVACAIQQLLSECGIIQLSSRRPVTKYEWAKAIADVFSFDKAHIHPKKSGDDISPRPMHVKMNTDAADEKGIKFHDVSEGLQIMRKQMNCIFKLIYKSKSVEQVYGVTVGEFRYDMGRMLAENIDRSIIDSSDCVVPVPNSGLFYAMGLAEAVNKPYLEALVKADSSSRSFNIADREDRQKYLRSKILPIKELLTGKNIMLVDEAIFTGLTLRTVCDALKACGAKDINICIPSPVCWSRCKQQVWPNRAVLSEEVAVEDLVNYFGVKTVTYLPRELFISKIKTLQDFFCYDCFMAGKE